jgi:hypothetical protein
MSFYWNVSDVTLDPLLSLRKDLKVWTDINFLLAHVRFMLFVLVHLQSNLIFICSLIAEQYDVKVSVNDIIIKVVAAALRNVPEANGK